MSVCPPYVCPPYHLTLYHYWRSSCSWRVRWALAIKHIACTLVHVDLLKEEHKHVSFLAKNPRGLVPVLDVNGSSFGESLAILEWLEEAFPQASQLLPVDIHMKMFIRQMAGMVVSGIQPLQNLGVQKFHSPAKTEQWQWSQHWIQAGFRSLETLLKKSAGDFCVANSVTLADICLVPQVYNALRFEVDLKHFPSIARIYQNCMLLDSCKETAPERYQPSVS